MCVYLSLSRSATFSYPQTLACCWCKPRRRPSLWAQWNKIFLYAIDPHLNHRNLGNTIRERERTCLSYFYFFYYLLVHCSFQFSKNMLLDAGSVSLHFTNRPQNKITSNWNNKSRNNITNSFQAYFKMQRENTSFVV